jgi:hypothetical protein
LIGAAAHRDGFLCAENIQSQKLNVRCGRGQRGFNSAARNDQDAPFPAVALMFAGSVKNRLRQRDGFKRNIIQVTIT